MKNRLNILYLSFFLLMAGMLGSCTQKHEADNCDKGEEIVIALSGDAVTRGMPATNNDFMKGKTIGIKALQITSGGVGSDYANGSGTAQVGNDLKAEFSPSKYWPAVQGGNSMRFYSWYPTSVTASLTASTKAMRLTHDANANSGSQHDIMAAISTPGWAQGVGIHFYHTLSQVTVSFKLGDGATASTVNKIQISGVAKTGYTEFSSIPANDAVTTVPSFNWTATATGTMSNNQLGTGAVSTTAYTQVGDSFLTLPMNLTGSTAKLTVGIEGRDDMVFDLKDIDITGCEAGKPLWKSGAQYNYQITINANDSKPDISLWVLGWGDAIPVNGNAEGRQLNVSETEKTLNALNGYRYRIYFWTDQKEAYVKQKGYTGATGTTEFDVNSVFTNLGGNSAGNLTFNASSGAGYIDIVTSSPTISKVYRIILNAGGLEKEITLKVVV